MFSNYLWRLGLIAFYFNTSPEIVFFGYVFGYISRYSLILELAV